MRRLLLLWALLPVVALAQSLDSLHIMVDAEAVPGIPHVYKTFQEAAAHFKEGTAENPMTVYIRPGVYWIDDPDDPTVKVGKKGREPFGMTVRCSYLALVGQGLSPEDVVLASQRGQTQGAIGNFTMFDFWVKTLNVENLTMGNYCNVDLVYPKNPRLNRPKRSDAITQAHVGYVHGDTLKACRVRFISRLNLNPLNGARYSYYEDCHFECTDDALNGTGIYRDCNFDFYGQKPFWSTRGAGAMFINCLFNAKSDSRELYFCKQGGPVTLIDCRFQAPSDSVYIGWTAYPQPWLRCYQSNFTLNGKPYLVGNRQPQNTLQPLMLNESLQKAPYLDISQHEATLLTGRDTLRLTCPETVRWSIPSGFESFVSLRPVNGSTVTVLPTNNTDEMADFCIIASAEDGREAACHVVVKPSILPPPVFTKRPRIVQRKDCLQFDYQLDLQGRRDESRITWYRNNIPVSVTHDKPERLYFLTAADRGQQIRATIEPKHQRSTYGLAVSSSSRISSPSSPSRISSPSSPSRISSLSTDFHDFPCEWQPQVLPGYWTVDGYKPQDTAAFPWAFDVQKPMWEYGEGFNGAVGKGLLQAQRGARLMYTPVPRSDKASTHSYGDMSLTLQVDPTKTAGQGFGSATGQYMDVCLKFDTQTLTGYGLRIIRTTKHAKAVDFLLVRYHAGVVTPISEAVSSTCYRTGCTISLDFNGNQLSAYVSTKTPQPADSVLPHEVKLTAQVEPNAFGGVHIQHTGSCGESTTMLHSLSVEWK